jgi:LytS/YehU family sensor histidine kinase
MSPTFLTNVLIAETDICTLVTVAYLISRSVLLGYLFKSSIPWQQALKVGLLFAFVAALFDFLPDARHPYAPSNLVVTFAAVSAGPIAGAFAAVGAVITAILLGERSVLVATSAALLVGVSLGSLVKTRSSLWSAASVAALAQGTGDVANQFVSGEPFDASFIQTFTLTVLSNGLGMGVIWRVIHDAHERAQAEFHRLAAEQSRQYATQAQLEAIRAKLHPHFLFNALNSIAALTGINAKSAERATVELGMLMRTLLAVDPSVENSLRSELAAVRNYITIEQFRLGDRLSVRYEISDDVLECHIPPLSLLTLVENAITHGFSKSIRPGSMVIAAHRIGDAAMIAVADNGIGIARASDVRAALLDSSERPHGIQLVNRQLELRHGYRSRIRIWSNQNKGTLVAFQVPNK